MEPAPTIDMLPVRRARTGGFRRGQPKSVAVFGDQAAWRVRYLASSGPEDSVQALHEFDHAGRRSILADPRRISESPTEIPAAERASRERLREGGAGITAYSCDAEGNRAVFALSGGLWVVDPVARPIQTSGLSVVDPRISPDGRHVAYHAAGGLHLVDIDRGATRCIRPADWRTWGLAEFIAAEEMGRYRGFWWSPDSDGLLVAAVDESSVPIWWIGDPADPATPPRQVRYPAAGTANASVRLWWISLDGTGREVEWDVDRYPYLAGVRWNPPAPLITVQSRDQRQVVHLQIDGDGHCRPVAQQQRAPWVGLVPGSPRLSPDGDIVLVDVDPQADAWRLRRGTRWLTPPQWDIRAIHRCDDTGIWVSGAMDATENHLLRIGSGGLTAVTSGRNWHAVLVGGPVPVVAGAERGGWQPRFRVGSGPASANLPNHAESPAGEPRVRFLPSIGPVRVAVLLPPGKDDPAPVIVSSYGGPHAQRVVRSPLSFVVEQWFADQGFAVVTIDGRGTPGVAPTCEEAISGDLAAPVLADQILGLQAAAQAFPHRLDLGRVGIRGWSFGGYLAALAVLREPDVFHAAFAGAPVTHWQLYDTHYTERYLEMPQHDPRAYERSSLIPLAAGLRRPLCLVHGLADDNVLAAHTLQLSAALTAHGRPHEVLPLPGVSHMTPQESITENLLRLEALFFQRHLRTPA